MKKLICWILGHQCIINGNELKGIKEEQYLCVCCMNTFSFNGLPSRSTIHLRAGDYTLKDVIDITNNDYNEIRHKLSELLESKGKE